MSLLEKLLCKLFRYIDITKEVDGKKTVYLRRWFVVDKHPGRGGGEPAESDPSKPKLLERVLTLLLGWYINRLCLHKMYRSDDDRDPHDHPWDFWTLILFGGYTDEQWLRWVDKVLGTEGRVGPVFERMRPGRLAFRPAEHLHRVQLEPGATCWTLVWMKAPRRKWGFVTETGRWIPRREYLKAGDS